LDQTIDVLKQVLAIRQQGLGPENEVVGRTWTSLGTVYAHANRLRESQTAFETGIGILRGKLGDRHPDLAAAFKGYAELRVRQGRLNDAEKLAREGLSIRMERLGPGSPGTIDSQLGLAEILRAKRSTWKYGEAEALLLAARTAATAARGAKDPGTLKATQGLSQLYDAWRKPVESAKWRATLSARPLGPAPMSAH
jgi:hypothetical protein